MTSHEPRIDPAHRTDGDYEILLCPFCENNWVHFDEVHVGGRPKEDGDFVNVLVDSNGNVRQNLLDSEMAKPMLGEMRRHYLSIVGWCETCHARFAYAFVQHKGQTKLQLIRPQWRTATARSLSGQHL